MSKLLTPNQLRKQLAADLEQKLASEREQLLAWADKSQQNWRACQEARAQLAECKAENERLRKQVASEKEDGFVEGMERAAEIILKHYPASQSIVGKELYQAIRAEIDNV